MLGIVRLVSPLQALLAQPLVRMQIGGRRRLAGDSGVLRSTVYPNGVAHIILSRPTKLNALNLPLFRALDAAAAALQEQSGVRAVVLSGDGRAFCAGLDVQAVAKRGRSAVDDLLTREPVLPRGPLFSLLPALATLVKSRCVHHLTLPIAPLLPVLLHEWRASLKVSAFSPRRLDNLAQAVGYRWRELGVPVVAALHGVCLGGGLQIALGADKRVAAPDCKLSILEAKWGLIPDMSGSITLREVLPMDLAKRYAWTGEFMSGEQAHAVGLVSELSEDPTSRALALAEAWADGTHGLPSEVKSALLASRRNRFHGGDRVAAARDVTVTRVADTANDRFADPANAAPLPLEVLTNKAFPTVTLPETGTLPASVLAACRAAVVLPHARGIVVETESAAATSPPDLSVDPATIADCLRSAAVPVIAQINGRCGTAATQVLLGADIRFGGSRAGLTFEPSTSAASVETRARELGGDNCMAIIARGGAVDATAAAAAGLVTVRDDPGAEIAALTAAIVTRSPDSVAACKALFNRTWHATEEASLLEESILQTELILGYNQIAASVKSLNIPLLSSLMKYRQPRARRLD